MRKNNFFSGFSGLFLIFFLPLAAMGRTVDPAAFPACSNDLPCDAVNMGQLSAGATLGNKQAGIYDNRCAGNAAEANPANSGSWYNQAGVWFSFTTGANPSPLIFIEVQSDPQGGGDPVDLQLALYRPIPGGCTGFFRFEAAADQPGSFDALLPLTCPRPNTTYYILVDGEPVAAGGERGDFGIQVREIAVSEASDSPCGAENLGAVPPGASVRTAGPRSNLCASSFQDPLVSKFATQVTVWFQFQAPPSGHVLIEGLSEETVYPLGVQLALFRAASGRCSDRFTEISSAFSDKEFNERLEASCLSPGETYWIMVDGYGSGGRGMFSVVVSDAGDNTPVTRIDTVLCSGDSLLVGRSVYRATGVYADTLERGGGCDSIVLTRLTVLSPVDISLSQVKPAVYRGSPGVLRAAVTGGAGGPYQIGWCDGSQGAVNAQIPAGADCRVTVTDMRGCHSESAITMGFVTQLKPVVEVEPVRCFGGSTGSITVSAGNGIAPYRYSLGSGTGVLPADGAQATIPGLPAGVYSLNISDNFGDTTLVVEVRQPAAVSVAVQTQRDASCFGACDGLLELAASGGTGSYRYQWKDGGAGSGRRDKLCAGAYQLTVTDSQGCLDTAGFQIGEPPLFTAVAAEVRPATCYGSSDGRAEVLTNGQPRVFAWNNGRDSALISGLEAGEYRVTVTNADGCQASAAVRIGQPAAPLQVSIRETVPISCFGVADGRLEAVVSGPYEKVDLVWSNGITRIQPEKLTAGLYAVVATNEKGCSARRQYLLSQPEPLRAEPVARNITCLDPVNGGEVRMERAAGGRPGYEYSIDGNRFQAHPAFAGLRAGNYSLWMRDRSGCVEKFEAEVQGPPELLVDLGGDRILSLGESVQITATSNSDDLIYRWEPAGLAPSGNPSGVVIQPLQSTAVRVTVEDTLTFCTASTYILLTVQKERKIFIPNAFSPNGDGNNDRLTIFSGPGTRSIRNFRIFSRTGALVYENRDLAPGDETGGWDGNFRGRPLSGGVYIYSAEIEFIDGVVEIFKGDVTLFR